MDFFKVASTIEFKVFGAIIVQTSKIKYFSVKFLKVKPISESKIVAIVEGWTLFRGHLCYKVQKLSP